MTNARLRTSRWIFAAVLAACLVLPASAASIAEYRENVELTSYYVSELAAYLDESEDYDRSAEAELIETIRGSLPQKEPIELAGGKIETSNAWLAARLDAFNAETDQSKRAAILSEIRERLDAISAAALELELAEASQRSKDEDKRKLGEILRRAEFLPPAQQQESAASEWLRKIVEWFRSLLPSAPAAAAPSGMQSVATGLQILLYVLIAGLIIFGAFKLAPVIFPKLKRKPKPKREDRVILGERIAFDESANDLFDEAERMARSGDTRGAIRKGYIALLCELSDRKIIGLARHKTNRDYLRDVRKDREVHAGLAGVTDSFERYWYGFRETAAGDWENFRTRCRETIAKV